MKWPVMTLNLVLAFIISYSSAACNVCQPNQAACINSTSFYLCFGNPEPDRRELYHCKRGFDCSHLNAICVQSSSHRAPSCGDTSLCGRCSANPNYKFACLSRTTFQMCYGALRPYGQIGYCPPGYVCYGASSAICVLEENVDTVTCDVVDSGSMTVSTTSPSPAPSLAPPLPTTNSTTTTTTTENAENEMLTPTAVCQQYQTVGLYPANPRYQDCKRYIQCYFFNGVIRGQEHRCLSGTYFHIQEQKCTFNKPTYCL